MDFSAPYSRKNYLDFLRDKLLPEDFREANETIRPEFKPQYTQRVTKIGHSPSLELNVYEVEHNSENDPRVSLSKESFRLLADHGEKRALMLFTSKTSNYRFSLVTVDLELEGRKIKREYSNPRRYSFFLGPDAKTHTPEYYLVEKGRVKDFDELKKRFSIEVVNKDFYSLIAALFTYLTGGKRKIGGKSLEVKKGVLVFPSPDDMRRKEFAVRLIGRLVFCWFLKKKSSKQGVTLLPEELLSTEAVNKSKGYYHNVLEPLFFEVLNTRMDERTKGFTTKPWTTIPFLNGGLFTPHEDDYYGSNEQQKSQFVNMLMVPDEWLCNLLNVFETYNFTIDENTPVDVELAIEPEMLGRIFENLLAEINPETGETARKATGSYYTPRPIVEYMVDESLKQYLLTKTNISEDKISSLLSYSNEQPELADTQKDSVIDALHRIKVIDPACGSGAFPMGILQKILLILQKLDLDSKKWLDKLLSIVPDPMYQKELKSKIDQPNYLHKLGIIRDCIYGVDIQPIAVEISKLRFFLSLIVDEAIDDSKQNRGVEHLPNLEFKFVCANTLIGLPKQDKQHTMFEDKDSINELKKLRDEYLHSYGKEKKTIEGKFRKVQSKMFEHSLNWNGKETQTLKLSQWDPFTHESNPWFEPEWMFGIKDGFDIVIANPPYVRVDDIEKSLRDQCKLLYKAAKGKYDLYYLFFEKSFAICASEATCVFISPNKFCAADSAENLRQMLFEFADSGNILSTSMLNVFEAAANYPIISILKKTTSATKHFSIRQATDLEYLSAKKSLSSYVTQADCFKIFPCLVIPINISQNSFNLIKRLYEKPRLLSDLVSISEGLRIPANLESATNQTFEIVKQYQFERYSQINEGSYISKSDLSKVTGENSDRYKKIMSSKILIAEDALRVTATIDCENRVPQGGVYFAVCNNNATDLRFLLGLLNSRLLSYTYETLYSGMHMGGGYLRYRTNFLESLPIPVKLGEDISTTIGDLVGKILESSSNQNKQSEVKKLEAQIDQIVYELYGLTPDEIAIVEGR